MRERLSTIIAVFIWLIFAVAGFFSIELLWGFNLVQFFSVPVLMTLLVITFIFLFPAVNLRVMGFFDHVSVGFGKTKYAHIIIPTFTALILIPIFYKFRSALTLLGDGNLRVNQISKGENYLPTELIDFFLHSELYQTFFKPYDLTPNDTYQLFSVCCGLLFIVGAYRLAAYLAPNQSLLTFLLFLSTGLTTLFFGYIESYSLIAALLPFIILTALKLIKGETTVTIVISWYLLAGLVHSSAIIILSGLIVFSVFGSAEPDHQRNRKIDRILLVLAFVSIILLYTARFFDLFNISYYLLPLAGSPGFQVGIFTPHHYVNIFNWMLLSGLPFLFLIGLIISNLKSRSLEYGNQERLAFWIAVPSLIFIFFFIPRLSGPRDWDLFALPTFLLVIAAVIFYHGQTKRRLPAAIIAVILISIINTTAFALVNSSVEMSADRFATIIETSRFKNLSKEYGTLVAHADKYTELKPKQLDYALKAWQEPPYTNQDSVFILQKLGMIYTGLAQKETALIYLKAAYQTDTLNLLSHSLLVNYLNEFATMRDVFVMGELIEKHFPENATALTLSGVIFVRNGDTARGEANLEKAIGLSGTNFQSLYNYGAYMLEKKNWSKAAELLSMASAVDKNNFLSWYYLAVTKMKMGRMEQAWAAFEQTYKLNLNNQQSKMWQELKTELQRLDQLAADSTTRQ